MTFEKIEQDAQALVQQIGIFRPPVPVDRIAELLNLEIREASTSATVSGALVRSGGKTFIAVNNSHHPNRQRFTIAHEIAHYRLEHEAAEVHVDSDFTVNYRDEKSSMAVDFQEIQANFFAASLLMPTNFLIKDVTEHSIVTDEVVRKLARRYQVSELAMTLRLSNLGFLSPVRSS